MIPPLLALFTWPLVTLIQFQRVTRAAGIAISIVAGYLLLPAVVAFDLPMLPALNKESVPSLAVVLALLVFGTAQPRQSFNIPVLAENLPIAGWVPKNPLLKLLFFGSILSVFMTVFTNPDRLVYGPTVLPGLRAYDAVSVFLSSFIGMLPLLLARKYLARPAQHRVLLLVLCMAGLVYSFLALYEIRMSPQLNNIFYGFFPSGWRQHVRNDGFRPLVFLQHGLWLGIFLSGSVLAALGYFRAVQSERKTLVLIAAAWIFMTLFLSKTLGAFTITILLAPFVLFASTRVQMIVVMVIASVILTYPMLRGSGYVPIDSFVSAAEKVSAERAQSLEFRLKNEDILLEKANQRPFFGWGSWGRFRVYDENGEDISVTDGRWIIEIGSGGWIGYLSRFGLLTVPLMLLALNRQRLGVTRETTALCLILAGNLIDMIPNGTLTAVTWLIAGALIGRLEVQAEASAEANMPARAAKLLNERAGVVHARNLTPTPAEPEPEPEPSTPISGYTRQVVLKKRQT